MLHRHVSLLLSSLVAPLGCAPSEPSPPPGDAVDGVIEDTAPVDSPAPTETGAPPVDTGSPPETAGPTDPPVDTTVPVGPRTPPSSWGGGLVRMTEVDVLSMRVDPGVRGAASPGLARASFMDLDSDGVEELLVAEGPGHPQNIPRSTYVLKWTPAGLVRDDTLRDQVAAKGPLGAPPLAVLDLDGDGTNDLLYGTIGTLAAFGRAEGGWDDPVRIAGTTGLVVDPGASIGLFDLDHDGWTDVWIGQYGCRAAAWPALRTGLRTWTLRRDLIPGDDVPARINAMSSVTLDDGTDVHLLIADICGQVDPHPGFYGVTEVDADGWPHFAAYDGTREDAWWKLRPGSAGAPITSLAAMGGGFGDLDGDGAPDLVVTVSSREQLIARSVGLGRFDDRGLETAIVRPMGPYDDPEYPWSVAFPDLDGDGRAELVMTIGDDAESFMDLRGHPLRNAVYWRDDRGAWLDVAPAMGLDAVDSYRGLSLADPDHDGDADLAIGGFGSRPVVYRNDVSGLGHPLALRLVGTTSDRYALGAKVTVEVAGLPTRTAWVGALANLDLWTVPTLFVGTGASATADVVRVRWPSGYTQAFRDVPADQLAVLTEAPTLEVLDADRHALAGTGSVGVRVTARREDGSLAPGATVTLRIAAGGGTLDGPVADGDGQRWTLRAPASAGSTVVEASIDGAPLRVRPRVWWDAP